MFYYLVIYINIICKYIGNIYLQIRKSRLFGSRLSREYKLCENYTIENYW